jgi:hypothetical protein
VRLLRRIGYDEGAVEQVALVLRRHRDNDRVFAGSGHDGEKGRIVHRIVAMFGVKACHRLPAAAFDLDHRPQHRRVGFETIDEDRQPAPGQHRNEFEQIGGGLEPRQRGHRAGRGRWLIEMLAAGTVCPRSAGGEIRQKQSRRENKDAQKKRTPGSVNNLHGSIPMA